MMLLKEHATRKTIEAIQNYPIQNGYAREYLDDGTPLEVKIIRHEEGYLIKRIPRGSAPGLKGKFENLGFHPL